MAELYELAQRKDEYFVTFKFTKEEVQSTSGIDIEWFFKHNPFSTYPKSCMLKLLKIAIEGK